MRREAQGKHNSPSIKRPRNRVAGLTHRIFLLSCVLVGTLLLFLAPVRADSPVIGLIYSRAQYGALQAGDDPLKSYRSAIEAAGGCAIALAPLFDQPFLQKMKNGMQGLVVPGGIDVDPKLYGESHIPELEEFDTAFDGFEMALVKDAARRRLPVLGICRGMQLINVCFGGSLYQDIPTQYGVRGSIVHRGGVKGKTTPSVHRISIESGSLLYTLLGVTSVEVNSSHHQSVKARAKGFRITARAADGVAEAMETTGPGLFLCVQFHPERLRASDPRFDRLFEWLVQKASEVPISPEEASPLPDR